MKRIITYIKCCANCSHQKGSWEELCFVGQGTYYKRVCDLEESHRTVSPYMHCNKYKEATHD